MHKLAKSKFYEIYKRRSVEITPSDDKFEAFVKERTEMGKLIKKTNTTQTCST